VAARTGRGLEDESRTREFYHGEMWTWAFGARGRGGASAGEGGASAGGEARSMISGDSKLSRA
jgi:hypothetical protein